MSANQAPTTTTAEASYLYAVIPRSVAQAYPQGFGPVRSVCEGELQALVSTVAAADWQPEALATRDAVGERAQRHQAVLQALLDRCTPLPMRMGTLLRGDAQVRELLQRAHALLADTLDGLQGRREWGVKLSVDRDALAREIRRADFELQSLEQRIVDATEGTRYLLEKRRDRVTDRRVDEESGQLAQRVRRELGAIAHKRAVLSAREGCALNESLLVTDDRCDALNTSVEALNERMRGLAAVELTGPWPPYSFAPVVQLGRESQGLER